MIGMFWLVILIAAAIQAGTPAPVPARPVSVRFHHLHYRTVDPLTAMRRAGGSDASPEILQGLGVGVRDAAEYLLFDRGPIDAGPVPAAMAVVYPKIVAWFRAQDVIVPPDPQRAVLLAGRVNGSVLEHIGFATSNLPELAARLSRSGVRSIRNNDESFFVTIEGVDAPLEIVRDPDLADRFWCAMHPDVRSPVEGACPICRMPLIPIPAPRLGEYRLDVTPVAATQGRGVGGLKLRVTEPDSTRPVAAFVTVHEKLLHLFVVSRDLSFFAHVHPAQIADGSFELRRDLPDGEYMVIADFLPAGGTPQTIQRAIVTPGFDARVKAGAAAAWNVEPRVTVGDVRVDIAARDLVEGRAGTLTVSLRDARTGEALTDFEPYLSAPAHALIASADLTTVVHAHARDQNAFGPEFSFDFLPSQSGPFKVWVQCQRDGQVLTLPFVVTVAKR